MKPNTLLWLTDNKEEAKDWADRLILGGKRNKDSYIYTAEITFNQPYIEGDANVNPEYDKYKDHPEYEDIKTEIFMEDLENYQEFMADGYDCFIRQNGQSTHYAIPTKAQVKFLNTELVEQLAYHSSDTDGITAFSLDYANTRGHKEKFKAIWLTTDKEYAQQFGKHLYTVDVDTSNMLREEQYDLSDSLEEEYNKLIGIEDEYGLLESEYAQGYVDFLLSKGYTGYVFPQNEGETIIVFDPKVITIKMNEQVAYHGSPVDFEQFDLDKFQRGDYGYGVYLTWDKDYASDYGKVKEYEIPDSDKLLHWEDTITWQGDYIVNAVKQLIDDIYEQDEDKYSELFENTWNYCNTPGFVCNGSTFYYKLSQILGLDGKATCDLLYKYGIKGIESDKGKCYCIFNPDDVKNIYQVLNKEVEEFI